MRLKTVITRCEWSSSTPKEMRRVRDLDAHLEFAADPLDPVCECDPCLDSASLERSRQPEPRREIGDGCWCCGEVGRRSAKSLISEPKKPYFPLACELSSSSS